MDNQKIVTVGIPAYNRPLGLRRTLENMCNQSYINIEILISDNCSPNDEVRQVAEEFCLRDRRVHYFRQDKNNGAYANAAFLVARASGEYFLLASDDDDWAKNYIEVLAGLLDQQPGATIAAATVIFKYGTIEEMDSARESVMQDNFDKFSEPNPDARVLSRFLMPNHDLPHLLYGLIRTQAIKKAFDNVLKYYSDLIATDIQLVLFLLCEGFVAVSRGTHKYYLCHYSTSSNFKLTISAMVEINKAFKRTIIEAPNLSESGKRKILRAINWSWWRVPPMKARALAVWLMRFFRVHNFYLAMKARVQRFLLTKQKDGPTSGY